MSSPPVNPPKRLNGVDKVGAMWLPNRGIVNSPHHPTIEIFPLRGKTTEWQ